ncbi:MAG: N-terminal acetyltransferase A complex catalytic subunit ard1 [Marteilia pararefringens]
MTSFRRMKMIDIYRICNTNLDNYVAQFSIIFYADYICKFPELCQVIENFSGRVMGHHINKLEYSKNAFHSHITSITVAPEYRKFGLASHMLQIIEEHSERSIVNHMIDHPIFIHCCNDRYVSCPYCRH